MLSNFDLEHMAVKYRIPNFRGVISKDQLTTRIETGSWILNLENEYNENGVLNPGSHWLSMYVDPNRFEEFVNQFSDDVTKNEGILKNLL